MDILHHADTQHRAVLIISLYHKLSTPRNLPYLKQSFGEMLEKIVDCYPQSDASDGIEQLTSLFLVLYSILCMQWSASSKPWSATDDAAEVTDNFFNFFFLIKNTV